MDLAKRNAGATNVLTQLFAENAFNSFDSLQKYNITGELIFLLYKDVCKKDITKMINVLENCENGNITLETLTHAIKNSSDGLDISSY